MKFSVFLFLPRFKLPCVPSWAATWFPNIPRCVVEACPGRCRTSMTWKRKGWEPWHLGPKNVLSPKKRRGKSVGNYTEILRHSHIHACMQEHAQTNTDTHTHTHIYIYISYIRIHCNKHIKLDLYRPVFQLLQNNHSWCPQLNLTLASQKGPKKQQKMGVYFEERWRFFRFSHGFFRWKKLPCPTSNLPTIWGHLEWGMGNGAL